MDEVREGVGDMISNGRRASEIVRRLRALAKKTGTQKVAVDINDAISEVIPLVQQEVISHGCRCAWNWRRRCQPCSVIASNCSR